MAILRLFMLLIMVGCRPEHVKQEAATDFRFCLFGCVSMEASQKVEYRNPPPQPNN